MSKNFKSAVTNRTLTVEGFSNGAFSVVFSDDSSRDLILQGDDAPALALAILESVGVAESSDVGVASQYLRAHIAEQERITAKAEAQAELEAEALELLNSGIGATFKSWPEAVRTNQPSVPNWLAVARRARELNKETTNGR